QQEYFHQGKIYQQYVKVQLLQEQWRGQFEAAVQERKRHSDGYIFLLMPLRTLYTPPWSILVIHETEIKPPGSKWSGPGPPEGRNRVEIGVNRVRYLL